MVGSFNFSKPAWGHYVNGSVNLSVANYEVRGVAMY